MPQGAKEVQFASYNFWLNSQFWLSFHAEPKRCKEYALKLLEAWNSKNPTQRVAVELKPIDRALQREYMEHRKKPDQVVLDARIALYRQDTRLIPLDWFAPEEIEVGLEGGEAGKASARVWVDTKRGILYYQDGDGTAEQADGVPGLPAGMKDGRDGIAPREARERRE